MFSFTICSNNYLDKALVLIHSLRSMGCSDILLCFIDKYSHEVTEEVKVAGVNCFYISELDLVDNTRMLDHIPRCDLVSLMRSSLAVIQPTTFEGGPGGGSVAMALSLGIPCIVSDIEVNKEIGQDKYIYYFEVNNVDDLLKKESYSD